MEWVKFDINTYEDYEIFLVDGKHPYSLSNGRFDSIPEGDSFGVDEGWYNEDTDETEEILKDNGDVINIDGEVFATITHMLKLEKPKK